MGVCLIMCYCFCEGDEDRQLYEDAMAKGYIESALTVLILVGVTGSGKTLFKRLVLGLPVPEYSPSTALAESAIHSMSKCQVAVGGGVTWDIVTLEAMLDLVADAIKEGVHVLDSSWDEMSQLPPSQCTDLDKLLHELMQGSMENSQCRQTSGHPGQQLPTSDVSEQLLVESDQRSAQRSNEMTQVACSFSTNFETALKGIDVDQKLMQRISKSSGCKKLMEINFVYISDSGGQPPFREMLHHFVHKSSAFVLMQKLNESLGFKPTIKYREEGDRLCGAPYQSQLTNEQILYQYFQAVQSHDSRVFVVGTHRDLEHECSESMAKKNQTLLESFRPILGERIVVFQPGDPDQLMFPVDCKTPKSEDKATAQAFRESVTNLCFGDKVKIPLPWFVLEQVLRQLAEKMHTRVLSIEECYEVARRKLHIPPNVCQAALNYLGRLNIVFYRPDILPQVVFCDSQVILDKITELVRCSHELKGSTSHSLPQNRRGGEWLKFRDYGKINSKLLKKFPSHYRKGLFTTLEFLQLLEGLLIAARLGSGEHFMPSVLPDLCLEEVTKHRVTSARNPAPMTLHYPKMWLPVGVFPSLVAYLQNHYEWTPVSKGGKPVCMYHNCMRFELPRGKPGSIVLIDSTKFLEIHVHASLRVASKVCPIIRDMILCGLEEAHISLHYDSAEAEEGFLCSGECGNTEAHFATMDTDKESWRCSENTHVGDDLDQRQTVWFGNKTQGYIVVRILMHLFQRHNLHYSKQTLSWKYCCYNWYFFLHVSYYDTPWILYVSTFPLSLLSPSLPCSLQTQCLVPLVLPVLVPINIHLHIENDQ